MLPKIPGYGTIINLDTSTEINREEIEQATEEFLKNGGVIQHIDIDQKTSRLNAKQEHSKSFLRLFI